MPTESFDEYLEKRTAERTPDEQVAFDIASAHFRAVAETLDAQGSSRRRRVLSRLWRLTR